MTISSISAASLGQYVLASSDSGPLQQALQTLQNSLASGDLNAAQSAFQTLQQLNQSLVTASGNSSSSSSQLSTDLTALGSALSSDDLATAQSAFATVQSDLKNAASPSRVVEENAASQSVQLVEGLLSSLNSIGNSTSNSSSSGLDNTNSLLESVYGRSGSLNVLA